VHPAGRVRVGLCRLSDSAWVCSIRAVGLLAPCDLFRLAEKALRRRVLQATDPRPSAERVPAFPSSAEGLGSVACNQHVPAFPSSAEGLGSVACNQHVPAFPSPGESPGSVACNQRAAIPAAAAGVVTPPSAPPRRSHVPQHPRRARAIRSAGPCARFQGCRPGRAGYVPAASPCGFPRDARPRSSP